jgi:hypothetical protein
VFDFGIKGPFPVPLNAAGGGAKQKHESGSSNRRTGKR